jgi:fido (protein-threonine AMPylation protein)
MSDLLGWLKTPTPLEPPYPIRAAIAHYQFATIHPYYDGNGRTARLLTAWILHLGCSAMGSKVSIRWRSITPAISAPTTKP